MFTSQIFVHNLESLKNVCLSLTKPWKILNEQIYNLKVGTILFYDARCLGNQWKTNRIDFEVHNSLISNAKRHLVFLDWNLFNL